MSPPPETTNSQPGWRMVLQNAMRTEGAQAGRDAADWWAQDTIGGRACGDPASIARQVLNGIDDGDPAIYDGLPTFASTDAHGSLPAEAQLIHDYGADPRQWTSADYDEAVAAYADSFDQAVLDRTTQLCRDTLHPTC